MDSDEHKSSDDDNQKARARGSRRRGNGVGQGKGWGGEAKGPGNGNPPFKKGGAPGPGRGHFSVAGEARKEAQYRRVETLLALLWDIATGDTRDETHTTPARVQAATHLLDRLQGKPVQMVASIQADDLSMMSDEELARDIERGSGKVQAFIEASMGENVPTEPDRVGD